MSSQFVVGKGQQNAARIGANQLQEDNLSEQL